MKVGLCAFSGYKIHPGHGKKFVRQDSKAFTFRDGKTEAYFKAKKNPRKMLWTQVYRRVHKKGTLAEAGKKKKTRKAAKIERAIGGASIEFLRAQRQQKPEVRAAARDAAIREIKEKKAKAKKAAGSKPKAQQVKQPKQPKQHKQPASKGR